MSGPPGAGGPARRCEPEKKPWSRLSAAGVGLQRLDAGEQTRTQKWATVLLVMAPLFGVCGMEGEERLLCVWCGVVCRVVSCRTVRCWAGLGWAGHDASRCSLRVRGAGKVCTNHKPCTETPDEMVGSRPRPGEGDRRSPLGQCDGRGRGGGGGESQASLRPPGQGC